MARKKTTRKTRKPKPPNPILDRLDETSRQELYDLATEAGIKNRSRMSKKELFVALGMGTREQIEPPRRGRPSTTSFRLVPSEIPGEKGRIERIRTEPKRAQTPVPDLAEPDANAEPREPAPAPSSPMRAESL